MQLALWAIAEVTAASDRAVEAVRPYYNRATEISETLGRRPLVADCHLGLGKLYWRNDQRDQAREHLAISITMYRDMEMTYWLELAEASRKEA